MFWLCKNTIVSCRVSILRTYRWQYPGLVTLKIMYPPLTASLQEQTGL